MNNSKKIIILLIAVLIMCDSLPMFAYSQDDDNTRNVLKQGLLGAGVGAISSSASGGNAGQGALIGAGTGVIGSALLDAITGPSSSSSSRRAPPPDDYYYADSPQDYYYEEPPQESGTSKVLKQGLVGAGTGALASGMSGGDAGKGALIGAGTAVIGNALLDAITTPAPQRRRVYRRAPAPQQYPPQSNQQYQSAQQPYQPQYQAPNAPQAQNVQVSDEVGSEGKKKIIKKYDSSGKLVSEEEIYYLKGAQSMKNSLWIAVILVLAALLTFEFRYTLVVNSPIVAKIDRLTGDVWIANSGMWLKVNHAVKDKAPVQQASVAKSADKTVQGKTK